MIDRRSRLVKPCADSLPSDEIAFVAHLRSEAGRKGVTFFQTKRAATRTSPATTPCSRYFITSETMPGCSRHAEMLFIEDDQRRPGKDPREQARVAFAA